MQTPLPTEKKPRTPSTSYHSPCSSVGSAPNTPVRALQFFPFNDEAFTPGGTMILNQPNSKSPLHLQLLNFKLTPLPAETASNKNFRRRALSLDSALSRIIKE